MSQSGGCLFADSELASLPVSVQVPSPSDAVMVTVQLGAAADSYESDLARGERFGPRREAAAATVTSFEWTSQACVLLMEGVREKSFVTPCTETLNTEVGGDGGYLWRMQEFMLERLRAVTPARLWATLPQDFGPTADEICVKLNHLRFLYGNDHQGFNECERACIRSGERELECFRRHSVY